jgi:hypothetical protein
MYFIPETTQLIFGGLNINNKWCSTFTFMYLDRTTIVKFSVPKSVKHSVVSSSSSFIFPAVYFVFFPSVTLIYMYSIFHSSSPLLLLLLLLLLSLSLSLLLLLQLKKELLEKEERDFLASPSTS